jgi:uncharacterized membrane protein HdeD (DUF308 family)
MEATAGTGSMMQNTGRPWWLVLIDGFALVIIGGILLWGGLLQKVQTYQLLVTLLGLWWIIRGIMDLVSMFVDHHQWGWKLFIGIVSIVAGSYILAYPIVSAIALPRIFVFVLGFWGLVNGIILLVMAFQGGGWGAGILGVLEIIIGIVLMANYAAPGMGLAFLWAAAVFAVIGGIVMIVRAFQVRKA